MVDAMGCRLLPFTQECTDSFTDSSVQSMYRNAIRSKLFVGKKYLRNRAIIWGGEVLYEENTEDLKIMNNDDVKTMHTSWHMGNTYQATAVSVRR